jgi:hypothetical protein
MPTLKNLKSLKQFRKCFSIPVFISVSFLSDLHFFVTLMFKNKFNFIMYTFVSDLELFLGPVIHVYILVCIWI